MFRPNRIGTPVIHTQTSIISTAAYTVSQAANSGVLQPFTTIGAAADGELGRAQLTWTGARAYAASNKTAFVQQFVVSKPIEGDTIGVELNGSLNIYCPGNALIVPVIFRCSAGLTPALAAGVSSDAPTPLDYLRVLPGATASNTQRQVSYQSRVIVNATNPTIAGVYAHGFAIYDVSGAAWNINSFDAVLSERQLNYQETVGYRDTLR